MHDKVFMKDPTEKYFSSEITELFKSKLERNVLFVFFMLIVNHRLLQQNKCIKNCS
jgi:hypothetical protein